MSPWLRHWKRPLRDIGLIAAFLVAVSYLPADTSLRERQKTGVLRFCVADVTSPLVTDPVSGGPGPELAQLTAAAAALDLRVQLIQAANIGRSFNPADWNISRGQCDLLGGGFADTAPNRGFMTLIPTGGQLSLLRTGEAAAPPAGSEVGIYLGSAGTERVRLSGWMRSQGWRAVPLRRPEDLQAWLRRNAPVVTTSLTPLPEGTATHPLPAEAGETRDLVFGIWRGDTTLTRALRTELLRHAGN